MQAVRKNRYVILPRDFEKAYKNVSSGNTDQFAFYS
jgi:ATP-dependent 26S proteasome regulatory subunit